MLDQQIEPFVQTQEDIHLLVKQKKLQPKEQDTIRAELTTILLDLERKQKPHNITVH